jgi:hypothetical protein
LKTPTRTPVTAGDLQRLLRNLAKALPAGDLKSALTRFNRSFKVKDSNQVVGEGTRPAEFLQPSAIAVKQPIAGIC